MKKITLTVLTLFIFVLLAGCIVARPRVAPPPLKKEVRTVRPGQSYAWISGQWKWSSSRYVWTSGHWVKARKGQVWAPGHWVRRGKHWTYVKGHWRRR